MATVSTINSQNIKNYSLEEPLKTHFCTTARIQKAVLYLFAALLTVAAFAAASYPTPYAFCAIPLILSALGIGAASYKIKDYESPKQAQHYRDRAAQLNFQKLYDEYDVKKMIQCRVLPLEKVKEKFHAQIREMNFLEVARSYDLKKLLACQIVEPKHEELLRSLKEQAGQIKAQYEKKIQREKRPLEVIKARTRFQSQMNALETQYYLYKQSLTNQR